MNCQTIIFGNNLGFLHPVVTDHCTEKAELESTDQLHEPSPSHCHVNTAHPTKADQYTMCVESVGSSPHQACVFFQHPFAEAIS